MLLPQSAYKATIWRLQVILLLGLLLFSYGSFASLQRGVLWVSTLFALLVVLTAYALLFYGSISLDGQCIRQSTILGTHEILWDEIKEIKYFQGMLVLIGTDKRLAVVDIEYWSAPDLAALREFYFGEVDKRSIPYEKDPKAMFLISRNSRVE